jgi:hypothetical protein
MQDHYQSVVRPEVSNANDVPLYHNVLEYLWQPSHSLSGSSKGDGGDLILQTVIIDLAIYSHRFS